MVVDTVVGTITGIYSYTMSVLITEVSLGSKTGPDVWDSEVFY